MCCVFCLISVVVCFWFLFVMFDLICFIELLWCCNILVVLCILVFILNSVIDKYWILIFMLVRVFEKLDKFLFKWFMLVFIWVLLFFRNLFFVFKSLIFFFSLDILWLVDVWILEILFLVVVSFFCNVNMFFISVWIFLIKVILMMVFWFRSCLNMFILLEFNVLRLRFVVFVVLLFVSIEMVEVLIFEINSNI